MKDIVAILDFGSQYTHLIARRVRELGVLSRIYPPNTPAAKLKNAGAIILSGGPRSVVSQPIVPHDPKIFSLGIPILGLCYGHQLMAKTLGGKVGSGKAREYGIAKIHLSSIIYHLSPLFRGVHRETVVWMSHGDHVEKLPKGFVQIATTGNRSIAAMADEKNKRYGFQFHPEVAHTAEGKTMLKNFLFTIARLKKCWTNAHMLHDIENRIRKEAKGKNIFLLVSGGVDSSVCFALLEKILGKNRVYGLLVDTGFMRKDETARIGQSLAKAGFPDLHVYNAEKEFLTAVRGVTDPEKKRKIIGNLFLDIADRVMKEKKMDGGQWLLGQGTIYPDTIESGGTKHADVIKTHHNRVPRVQKLIAEGRVIEPLRDLYKDEVREIGRMLGLPKALIERHPFPGPGLAIRCLCANSAAQKDKSFPYICNDRYKHKQEIITIYKLPLQSVGVQGDERSYSHPALVAKKTSWKKLRILAPMITNKHKDINRVLYLITGNPKNVQRATVRKTDVNKKRLDLLRTIDDIVQKEIHGLRHIWQFPVVLVPFGHDKGESIVLRPVESEEAMTVSWAELPQKILQKMIKKIMTLRVIDFIFFDVTNKPPGTIEWE